jgi:hypothetical protein
MLSEEFTDNIRPRWHPRVPRYKIRQLYQNDAAGLLDVVLIDDVGINLLLRCRSILTVTEAHAGRAACGRCGAVIVHHFRRQEELRCESCGWQTTWGACSGLARESRRRKLDA